MSVEDEQNFTIAAPFLSVRKRGGGGDEEREIMTRSDREKIRLCI
jgi:hypothetical protein